MSDLFPNYKRRPIEFLYGEKSHVTDSHNKEYLDLTSGIGVMNLGYNHPILNQALNSQLQKIWHTPNLYENSLQEQAAKELSNSQYISYFCNSGAEANEAAIKLARKITGKKKIITFTNSFHGRTFGAMSATGQASIHEGYYPLLPEFTYVAYNTMEFVDSIDGDTAAVMLELIQGEGGVIPAKREWIQKVAEVCKQKKILMIVDEVQTGIGRTGTLYAYEHYQIEPDILTLAKGLGNGIPVGAMLGKKQYAEFFGPGSHGSTFGGNKLALSVVNEVLQQIKQPVFLESVQAKGMAAMNQLEAELSEVSIVKEIRGVGLMLGIELISANLQDKLLNQLEEKGILVLKAGKSVLRLLPPLIITQEELEEGISIICATIKENSEG